MIRSRSERTEESDHIKSRFLFKVPVPLGAPPKRFRDPVALEIFQRLAEHLRKKGLKVTDPKPGKACDAAFRIEFRGYLVVVIILAERTQGFVDCSILTWCARSVWHLSKLSQEEVFEGWSHACSMIDQALSQHTQVISLRRMTETEADTHWEATDS
jgi:hypothetical protein